MTKPAPAAAPEAAVAQANISPQKEAQIRKLLDLAGVKESAMVMMSGMESSMKPLLTNSLPPGAYRDQLIELFLQRFHEKATIDKIVDMAIPTYDKYFSEEELKSVVNFYETPVGRKALAAMPKIVAELQQQGQSWGRQVGQESMTEVLDEHPDLKKELEDAARNASSPKPQ